MYKIITAFVVVGMSIYLIYYFLFAPDLTDKLFMAIKNNNVTEAKFLIDKGADINGVRGPIAAKSILTEAIEYGSSEIVALLLSKGVRVEKNPEWSKLPLDHSADIALGFDSITRKDWETIRQNQRKIIPLLMAGHAPTKHSEITLAILTGDLNLVKKLSHESKLALERGEIRINDLIRAIIFSGNKEIINHVINNMLDDKDAVNKIDLLQLAVKSDNPEIIDYILSLPNININASE
ncbi:MAG: ankyrin repeat domain-containing protein [Candidatus Babeliaceae bacterium]